MSELVPVVVDLDKASNGVINESWLAMFGGAVEMMLRRMFSQPELSSEWGDVNYSVRGTPSQIASFGDALAGEKRYMETFMKYGLNDPRSFRSRHELEKAVASFERETNLKWPFK